MEAQQQTRPAAASTRWHTFAEWLSRQAGGLPEEAVSQASASDAEEDDLTSEPAAAAAPSSSSSSSSSARGAGAALAATAPMTPGQLARHATLAPRLPDCRAETRLTGETASRARQEMTVMLAAPGMPLHQAPVLTAKQASALMSAICEPLLSLPVGRLTRKLSAPTKLQPTEERGVLSLWLLPDDSLSLVWQSAQQLAPEELAAATEGSSEGSGESCSSKASVESGAGAASPSSTQQQQAEQAPQQLRQSCSVAVWEELAHFPALAHLMDDVPVVTIHMLRGDASGRSFYIRVRNDVAESNLEAATAAVSDAACLVPQRGSAAGAALEGGGEAEASGAPRMYFWLAGRDLGQAVYSLGRLKSLLKRPPTLAKRSGVPERQLAQLGAWVARADAAAAEQQRAAAAEVQQQQEEQEEEEGQQQVGLPGPVDTAGAAAEPAAGSEPASTPVRAALPASSSSFRSSLSPLLQAPAAGLLLGQHGMPMQGSMAALLPPTPPPACAASPAAATATSSSSGPGDGGGEAGPVACGSSTVSATAAALYQDHRFNLVCPCTISVVVGMKVQAAGADPAALPAEASVRARAVAERQAKAAVDRSGRQRIEERLAEVVIRNIRMQRNRARAARQQQRDSAGRRAQVERAAVLARMATGRSAAPEQQQEQAQAAAWAPPPPFSPLVSPFAAAGSSSNAAVAPTITPAGCSTGRASAMSGSLASASIAGSSSRRGHALSTPTPMAPALLPAAASGRVTLDNLHSLLTPPASHGSASSELGAAATSAAGPDAAGGGAGGGGARVSVADLADLLNKHAKLE